MCQVRLDFDTFRMSGPDLSSRVGPYGRCRGDRMAVFTTQHDLGLSEGNLLCDRFKSMQKRNVIETRVKHKIVKNRRKRKLAEKRSYKMGFDWEQTHIKYKK